MEIQRVLLLDISINSLETVLKINCTIHQVALLSVIKNNNKRTVSFHWKDASVIKRTVNFHWKDVRFSWNGSFKMIEEWFILGSKILLWFWVNLVVWPCKGQVTLVIFQQKFIKKKNLVEKKHINYKSIFE